MRYVIKRYKPKRKNKTRKTYLKRHRRKYQKGSGLFGLPFPFPLLF